MGANRRSEERICIVGASAAGLFAAWRLATAGRPVVVYERDGAVAGPRTLIVTAHLRRLWPDSPRGIRHRITGFDLWAGGVRRILQLREPDWVIDRAEVRAMLLQLARAAGAEIRTGWAFAGRDGDRPMGRDGGGPGSAGAGRGSGVAAAGGADGALSNAADPLPVHAGGLRAVALRAGPAGDPGPGEVPGDAFRAGAWRLLFAQPGW